MKPLLLILTMLGPLLIQAQNKIPTAESQIKTALYACPDLFKDGAKVLGYAADGKLTTLRDGSNEMVCLADDPRKDGISVSCYSEKLEPYMARGRALIDEGKTEAEKREIRKIEIDNGSLSMPETPAAVYVVTAQADAYDAASGALSDHKIRYVLYKPYMTAKETGLPTQPSLPGMPWLMDAGTHRSHIMITPAAPKP